MPDPSSAWAYQFFFFNDTATTEIYTLSLHDALPISFPVGVTTVTNTATDASGNRSSCTFTVTVTDTRSEEHTSELQSLTNLVCRLLLEKKTRRWTSCMDRGPSLAYSSGAT